MVQMPDETLCFYILDCKVLLTSHVCEYYNPECGYKLPSSTEVYSVPRQDITLLCSLQHYI